MGWNYEALEFWLTLAVIVISAVGEWIRRSIRQLARKIDELETSDADGVASLRKEFDGRMDTAESRLGGIETRLGMLPSAADVRELSDGVARLEAGRVTHDDVSRVHGRLDAVASKVSTLDGKLDAIDSSLGRIHEFLLNRS